MYVLLWEDGEKVYRVVIVDDEPIIVEGLKKSIDWKKLDCEIVGCAYNGVEGMKVIRERRPNILFTDICMSLTDGLTMIAGLRSEYSDMEITILTGYRDFDYAQEAIRLGVTRFLLKPSKIEEIEEAIETMKNNLGNAAGAHESDDLSESEDQADNNFIVKNALEYMEDNYPNRLSLAMVADNVYVSQWHLSKLLNHYKGQSFSDILNSIRIEKAKDFLTDPSLRVCEISEKVGFVDVAHFSRVFKKYTGASPQEYRNAKL